MFWEIECIWFTLQFSVKLLPRMKFAIRVEAGIYPEVPGSFMVFLDWFVHPQVVYPLL